jgi:RNA polymerase primary sigma factor
VVNDVKTQSTAVIEQTIAWLRNHDWPISTDALQELTFEHPIQNVGLLRNESAAVRRLYQLRPLRLFSQTIFILDSLHRENVSRAAIRRIAAHFSARPIVGKSRSNFDLRSMVFISTLRGGNIVLSHLAGEPALKAGMATIGPISLHDTLYVDQVLWSNIEGAGIQFGDGDYSTFDRTRSPDGGCSRGFVDKHGPEYLSLFDASMLEPPISQFEEDLLFVRLRGARKATAFDRIVRLNLGKVFDVAYSVTQTYCACRPSFECIFEGALEGLMIAIQKYQYSRSNRFSSYSWLWIYRYAIRALPASLRPFRLPLHVWDRLASSVRELSQWALKEDVEGVDSWDAGVFSAINEACLLTAITSSEQVNEHFGELYMNRLVEIEAATGISELEFRDHMAYTISGLSHRYATVLLLRIGAHTDYPKRSHTLEEIGQVLGITRERVRQIELRAIGKIEKLNSKSSYDS